MREPRVRRLGISIYNLHAYYTVVIKRNNLGSDYTFGVLSRNHNFYVSHHIKRFADFTRSLQFPIFVIH